MAAFTNKEGGVVMISIGSTGERVREWQRWLNLKGFNASVPDGSFGPKTLAAVKRFQIAANLKPDGVIGPITENARRNWGTTLQRAVRPILEPIKAVFPRLIRFIVV